MILHIKNNDKYSLCLYYSMSKSWFRSTDVLSTLVSTQSMDSVNPGLTLTLFPHFLSKRFHWNVDKYSWWNFRKLKQFSTKFTSKDITGNHFEVCLDIKDIKHIKKHFLNVLPLMETSDIKQGETSSVVNCIN